jgi:predicted nucleotidyltransferase
MSQATTIEQTLKEIKPYLRDRFNVSNIGYFGSYAKGTATKESDIDLIVEFSETPGWEYVQLKFFLEEQLKKTVDLVTNNALRKQLKKSILKDVKYI